MNTKKNEETRVWYDTWWDTKGSFWKAVFRRVILYRQFQYISIVF